MGVKKKKRKLCRERGEAKRMKDMTEKRRNIEVYRLNKERCVLVIV